MKISNKSYLLLIALLTFVAYSNCWNNEFLWDDEFLIQKNTYIRSFENFPKMLVSNSTAGFGGKDNFYRPTQNIYYLFIYKLFGESKVAFHLGNILLHLINALLIFFLILRITKNNFIGFAGSVLWSLHPTHVEAVTYISGTADPMGLMFVLLSLLSYPVENIRKKWPMVFLSFLFFILALLSKEATIVAPALLVLFIFIQSKDPWKLKTYLPTLLHWSGAFAYLIARKTILDFNATFEFYKESNIYSENILYRLYTYMATLPEYLNILVAPYNLHMERRFPVFINPLHTPVIFGFLILSISLTLCLVFVAKKKNYIPLFCWLWFFGAFVPMNGILLPVNSFILEHWLYLPSIGFFIAIAILLGKLHSKRPRLTLLILFTISSFFMGATLHRNTDWKDPITFYSNILEYSDGSARVHNNLGMAYADLENWNKAITHYNVSIGMADSYPQTHYNLARIFIRKEQYQKALSHLNRSLEIDPNFRFSLTLKSKLIDHLKSANQ